MPDVDLPSLSQIFTENREFFKHSIFITFILQVSRWLLLQCFNILSYVCIRERKFLPSYNWNCVKTVLIMCLLADPKNSKKYIRIGRISECETDVHFNRVKPAVFFQPMQSLLVTALTSDSLVKRGWGQGLFVRIWLLHPDNRPFRHTLG